MALRGRRQPLHRPDGLQPDRQRQDRGLPAAGAAHPAAAAGRRRSQGTRRLRARRRRSRRQGRARSQAPQAQGPDQLAQFQGRHARRADPVPDARTRAAGGARRHRPGQALPRPARRQRGGRHALPVADRQAAERRPGGGHARPPAGPAALDADQARQGAVPGRGRSRPHARPGLLRRPGRSQPAHHPAQADHDVQRHLRAAHPATGHARDARAAQDPDRHPAGKARQHQAGAVLGRQRPAQAQAAGPLAARHHDQPGHRVSPAPRSSATAWPTTCSRTASTPSRCTAP